MRKALVLSWIGLAFLTVLVLVSAPASLAPSLGIGVQSAEMCANFNTLPHYDPLTQADGRINQVAHFGGDAIYCDNAAANPTNDLSVLLNGGAFRVLDMHGNSLWSVSADQITAAIAQNKSTGQGVEVGTGSGSYGPVSLWVIGTDANGDPMFQFNGMDEHGKSNSLEFNSCTPVNPIPTDHTAPASSEATCFERTGCSTVEPIPCSDPLCDITYTYPDFHDANHNGRTDDFVTVCDNYG